MRAVLLACVLLASACGPRRPPPRVTPNPPSPLVWLGRHVDVFNHELMTRDEFDLRYELALSLNREAEWQAALAHLESLREARPNFWVIQLEYARAAYMILGPTEAIEAALEHSLELEENNPAALILLGQVHEDQGQLEEAKAFYQRALAYRPGDPLVRHGLARVLSRSEQHADALVLYTELVRESPRDVRLRMELAVSLERSGSIDTARVQFREVAKRHTDPLQGHQILWSFLKRHGPEGEAQAVERKVLKMQKERDEEGRKDMRPLLPSRR